jgi:hypothetical protein
VLGNLRDAQGRSRKEEVAREGFTSGKWWKGYLLVLLLLLLLLSLLGYLLLAITHTSANEKVPKAIDRGKIGVMGGAYARGEVAMCDSRDTERKTHPATCAQPHLPAWKAAWPRCC